jgi:class 3 adenylate cyclase
MRRTRATTELVTVLFTDIVSSTRIAEEVGDRRWRELVDAHHGLVRQALRRHNGRELDTAGDGFFAAFSKPADAIRCAVEVSDGVHEFGLEIRAGLHLGEAEIMGEKVGGVAVNTGARIMSLGTSGEVLVSATIRDAVAGKDIVFVDHGVHTLKGLEGEFRVYDVSTVDGVARALPLEPEEARRRRERPPASVVTKRPWWLAVAGAGLLVVAVVAIVGVLRRIGDEPATGATTPIEGRALSDADEQLIGLVPTAFAASCGATDPLPSEAVGSVTCTDGDYDVQYDTYLDAGALDGAFGTLTAGLEISPGSCRDQRTATGTYDIDSETRGKVVCFVESVSNLAYGSTILWTDDAALILGRATREDVVDFEGNVADLSLYEWWRTSAGPITSTNGSFRPKDDPADVVSGTFTSVITADDVGPSNEGGADRAWVGTWIITMDGDAFRERLVGQYEITSGLLWGKPARMILVRDYQFPPLGGITASCRRLESLGWRLVGDQLVFSDPSPEEACDDFRGVAVFRPWQRVD